MRIEDAMIFNGEIDIDDDSLIRIYDKSKKLVDERKNLFDTAIENYDKNNYYDFLIMKLYYEFAIEEYNKLKYEVDKRNLQK